MDANGRECFVGTGLFFKGWANRSIGAPGMVFVMSVGAHSRALASIRGSLIS
jgi:hypothetical protein